MTIRLRANAARSMPHSPHSFGFSTCSAAPAVAHMNSSSNIGSIKCLVMNGSFILRNSGGRASLPPWHGNRKVRTSVLLRPLGDPLEKRLVIGILYRPETAAAVGGAVQGLHQKQTGRRRSGVDHTLYSFLCPGLVRNRGCSTMWGA